MFSNLKVMEFAKQQGYNLKYFNEYLELQNEYRNELEISVEQFMVAYQAGNYNREEARKALAQRMGWGSPEFIPYYYDFIKYCHNRDIYEFDDWECKSIRNIKTVGKLQIFKEIIGAFTFRGIRHKELGVVLPSRIYYNNFEIIDDNNFFVSEIIGKNQYDSYLVKKHLHRGADGFEEKFQYKVYYDPIIDLEKKDPPIKIINDDVVLLSKEGNKSLYSLSQGKEISITFSDCSEFVGENGKKQARVEIPIPYEFGEFKKPCNYLYATIDEHGNCIGEVLNLNTEEAYTVSNENNNINTIIEKATSAENDRKSQIKSRREELMKIKTL